MSSKDSVVFNPDVDVTRSNHASFLEGFRAVVESRRSVRRFTDTPIPDDVLGDCFSLAMRAPNSSNLQPWEFVLIESPATRLAAVEACMKQNAAKTCDRLVAVVARTDTWQQNAKDLLDTWPVQPVPSVVRTYYSKLIPAEFTLGPFGLIGQAKKLGVKAARFLKGPLPKPSTDERDVVLWASVQAALAAENFMLALKAHGFDSCPMGGFDPHAMHGLLGLGKGSHIVMMIAAGEKADDGIYHKQFRFAPEHFIRRV